MTIRASFPEGNRPGNIEDQGPHRAGFFIVLRSFWDDPGFADCKMSEREAYLWMVHEASWKARCVRFENWVVDLQRGQLAVSCRFLAARFLWSEPSVRRYLKRLETRRRIRRNTDAGITVITLLDYDEIQLSPRDRDAVPPFLVPQGRRTSDANQNTIKKGKNKKEALDEACKNVMPDSSARQVIPPTGDAVAIGFHAAIRMAVGLPADHMSGYWSETHLQNHVRNWRALGLSDARIIAESEASRARNPTPPDGPKALDRWMEAAARDKRNAPIATDRVIPQNSAEASTRELLEFWAGKLNSDAFVAASAISVQTAKALVETKLVEPGILRHRGIAF